MVKKLLLALGVISIFNLNAMEIMPYNKVEEVYGKLLPDVVAQVGGKNYSKEDFMRSLKVSAKVKIPSDAKIKKHLPNMVKGFALGKAIQNMAAEAGFTPNKKDARIMCDKRVASFMSGNYKKYFLKDLKKKRLDY